MQEPETETKCAKSIDQAAGGVLRQINKKSLLLSE